MKGIHNYLTSIKQSTFGRIFAIILIISILQVIIIKPELCMCVFTSVLINIFTMTLITCCIGYPLKWYFKSKKGLWVGFALALVYDFSMFIYTIIFIHFH